MFVALFTNYRYDDGEPVAVHGQDGRAARRAGNRGGVVRAMLAGLLFAVPALIGFGVIDNQTVMARSVAASVMSQQPDCDNGADCTGEQVEQPVEQPVEQSAPVEQPVEPPAPASVEQLYANLKQGLAVLREAEAAGRMTPEQVAQLRESEKQAAPLLAAEAAGCKPVAEGFTCPYPLPPATAGGNPGGDSGLVQGRDQQGRVVWVRPQPGKPNSPQLNPYPTTPAQQQVQQFQAELMKAEQERINRPLAPTCPPICR